MKKITVSVGIPAFNEEQNIEALVRSLIAQKFTKVTITEICIISDSSTDKTHEIVRRLAKEYPQVKLLKRTTRKGKYFRMNELFARLTADVLIVMDADIALKGENFIETLTMALIKDPKAQMVSARNIFIRPQGFMARVIYTHFMMWDSLLLTMPGVDAGVQFSGTATAFRHSYARSLQIPLFIHNTHMFLYLAAKKVNGFRFCPDAQVLQIVPTTIDEIKTLLVRDISNPDEELDKLFGKEIFMHTQIVPRNAKMQVILKSFLQEPLYTPFALMLAMYVGRLSRQSKRSNTQLWTINKSTKRVIAVQK